MIKYENEKRETTEGREVSGCREDVSYDKAKTEAEDIKVTEEMIVAGAAVLAHSSFYLSSEEIIAENVYRAMRLVCPQETLY